jgi:3-oxoadipate enol-lactonase/4-carboxymuconolactone decarboxylase
MPRGWIGRLERRMEAERARLERVRYARPEAGGEVEAWRLVPREPRARVVAAHGAGNDALYPHLALFEALVRRGVEVFAFDVDGHGAGSTTVFTPDAVLTSVAAAIEQAERGRAALPLHLLGHSFGGSLVLHALAEGSVAHAASAVVISAPTSISLDARSALAELRGFLRLATLGQRRHYGLWGMVPAVGPLKRRAYPIRGAVEAGAPFAYVAAIRRMLARLDLDRASAKVRVPVLLVYGEGDRLVPPAQGRRLAELIPSSTLLEIPGATHWSTGFAPSAIARAAEWIEAHSDFGGRMIPSDTATLVETQSE